MVCKFGSVLSGKLKVLTEILLNASVENPLKV
jgi:hypothetical protein